MIVRDGRRRRRRRREDRTTAQLILETSNRGKSVSTTTLSFVQTVQQPHFHTQITKINHINLCSQFTDFTFDILTASR